MLIAEDGIFRNKWPMGRVTNVFLGHDDKVRSAKVRTATSEIHRPVSKLCLLEEAFSDDCEENRL